MRPVPAGLPDLPVRPARNRIPARPHRLGQGMGARSSSRRRRPATPISTTAWAAAAAKSCARQACSMARCWSKPAASNVNGARRAGNSVAWNGLAARPRRARRAAGVVSARVPACCPAHCGRCHGRWPLPRLAGTRGTTRHLHAPPPAFARRGHGSPLRCSSAASRVPTNTGLRAALLKLCAAAGVTVVVPRQPDLLRQPARARRQRGRRPAPGRAQPRGPGRCRHGADPGQRLP